MKALAPAGEESSQLTDWSRLKAMPQHLYTGPHGTTLKAPQLRFEPAAKLDDIFKHHLGPNLRFPVAAVRVDGNYAIVTFGKDEQGQQIAFKGHNTWAFFAAADGGPPHAIIKSGDAGHAPILGKPAPRHGQLFQPGEFTITPLAVDVLHHYEGFRLEQYSCAVEVNTICYGAITWIDGGPVPPGQRATQAQCDQLFERDSKKFVDAINALVKRPLVEPQMVALIDMAYNCGVTALKTSTLLRMVNANASDAEIQHQFRRWDTGGIPGLVARCNLRASLWIGDIGASRDDYTRRL